MVRLRHLRWSAERQVGELTRELAVCGLEHGEQVRLVDVATGVLHRITNLGVIHREALLPLLPGAGAGPQAEARLRRDEDRLYQLLKTLWDCVRPHTERPLARDELARAGRVAATLEATLREHIVAIDVEIWASARYRTD